MAPSAIGRGGKKITPQAIIGEQGVTLIAQIVLRMGSAWHSLNASLDAGIDGQIELVDPDTHEATNAVIRVQSKATMRAFPNETDEGFDWPCDERDLDYWMSGNAPVILVVTRPHLNEAYWVPVRDYFAEPARKKAKRVRFDKRTMRLTKDSYPELAAIAIPKNAGIYFAPRPREERVYSNLLEVSGLPERLWIAETDLRLPGDVFAALREAGVEAPEFVLKDRRILAAHDLTEPPWSAFVDRGTVEEFAAAHWAQAEDPDLTRLFVELLNHCLTARCRQINVERRRDDGMYYFTPTDDLTPRVVPYRSVKESAERKVFLPYMYTSGDRAGEVSYYRHNAFFGQFRRFDGQWHLEIEPTYFFSEDGRRRHRFYESKLKGIKKLEKNGTVLGQVVMWAALLRGREENDEGMFGPAPYRLLRFGPLATFDLPVGIDDGAWLPNEEGPTAKSVSLTANDLPLFVEVDPYASSDGATGEEEDA